MDEIEVPLRKEGPFDPNEEEFTELLKVGMRGYVPPDIGDESESDFQHENGENFLTQDKIEGETDADPGADADEENEDEDDQEEDDIPNFAQSSPPPNVERNEKIRLYLQRMYPAFVAHDLGFRFRARTHFLLPFSSCLTFVLIQKVNTNFF